MQLDETISGVIFFANTPEGLATMARTNLCSGQAFHDFKTTTK